MLFLILPFVYLMRQIGEKLVGWLCNVLNNYFLYCFEHCCDELLKWFKFEVLN